MAATPAPTIDALPTAPSRSMAAATFVTAANAWVAAQPTFRTQINAAGAAAYANALATAADAASTAADALTASIASAAAILDTDYAAESASSLSLTAGSKVVHLTQAGKAFAVGDLVALKRRGDPEAVMFGAIDAWDGVDDMTISVVSDGILGSGGPFADWIVFLAIWATPGATVADVRAGLTNLAGVTPASLMGAAAFQTLTDGATINWDTALGYNAKVTLGGNRTVAAPTNLHDGLTYALFVKQDGTGSRTITWNAVFDWGSIGAPTLSTTAAKVDQVYAQYSADTGKLHATFRKSA